MLYVPCVMYRIADILLIPELDEDGNDEDHRGLIHSTLTLYIILLY